MHYFYYRLENYIAFFYSDFYIIFFIFLKNFSKMFLLQKVINFYNLFFAIY